MAAKPAPRRRRVGFMATAYPAALAESQRRGRRASTRPQKLRCPPAAAIHMCSMDTGIASINDQVKDASAFAYKLREEIGTVIVGQRYLVDRLLVGLLANGHVLLEGVPGLAKTLSVKTLAH